MAIGNITGKTNVPSKLIEYTGLSTYTTDITIDNQFYTFAVDVKRVPYTLTITENTLHPEWIAYDGSETQHIDLSPIIINDEDFEDYDEDALTKIYRKPTGDNFIEAPYIVNKEAKEPVSAYVDFSVSGISNNSPIPANKFLSSFDDDLSSFIGSVDVVNLYANIYNDGDYSGSYMRLGSKNNLGSITLYLNYTISSIRIGASKYFTDAGNLDANAQLFVNGQEVELSDEATTEEYLITLNNPSSTIIIENRRSSGNDKGRVFITSIGNGEGGTTYSEKQLATKDNVVDLTSNQEIHGNKQFIGEFRAYNPGGEYSIQVSDDAVYQRGYLEKTGDLSMNYGDLNVYEGSITLSGSYLNINTGFDDCYVYISNQNIDYAIAQISGEIGDSDVIYNVEFDADGLRALDDGSQEDVELTVKLPAHSGKLALEGGDIIDRITREYDEDEDETYFFFPEYVLPESISFEDEENVVNLLYFNYVDEIIVDSDNTTYGNLSFDENHQAVIVLSGDRTECSFVNVVYSKVDGTNYIPVDYSRLVRDTGTKMYKHHFDLVVTSQDLALLPSGASFSINVNALSTSGTPWATLSELDGGGFIEMAFGNIPNNYSYVFELKLFYSALNTLLLNVHDLTDGSVKCAAITTVGGGQTPNTFALEDSVTPL